MDRCNFCPHAVYSNECTISIQQVYKTSGVRNTDRIKVIENQIEEMPYSWTSLECTEWGRRCDAGTTLLYMEDSEAEPTRTDVGLSFHASPLVCAALYDTDPDDTDPSPPAPYAPASADLVVSYDTGRFDDELLLENSPFVIPAAPTAAALVLAGSQYSYTGSTLPMLARRSQMQHKPKIDIMPKSTTYLKQVKLHSAETYQQNDKQVSFFNYIPTFGLPYKIINTS